VAEVISSYGDGRFAYLGYYNFSGKVWDLKLTSAGIFAASSRAVQVVVLCFLVNACVVRGYGAGLAVCGWLVFVNTGESTLMTDDDSTGTNPRYLDSKTQLILFLGD
jgi:hypothetical protein